MECVIILNGTMPEKLDKSFFAGKTVYCADGAYKYAEKNGIWVDLLIGDFDSLKSVPENVKTLRFSRDKDETDGELALNEAVKNGFKDIVFIGAAGKREDHFYANIMLLYRALKLGVSAAILTDLCKIYMFDKDISLSVREQTYFSIVPFGGELHIMNTEGLKYGITDRTLHQHETLGISNVTTGGTVKITVKSGCGIAFATNEPAAY